MEKGKKWKGERNAKWMELSLARKSAEHKRTHETYRRNKKNPHGKKHNKQKIMWNPQESIWNPQNTWNPIWKPVDLSGVTVEPTEHVEPAGQHVKSTIKHVDPTWTKLWNKHGNLQENIWNPKNMWNPQKNISNPHRVNMKKKEKENIWSPQDSISNLVKNKRNPQENMCSPQENMWIPWERIYKGTCVTHGRTYKTYCTGWLVKSTSEHV